MPIHLLGLGAAGAPVSVQAEQDRLDLRGVDHHARRTAQPLVVRVRRSARRACRSAPTSPSEWFSTATSSRSGSTRRATCRAGRRSWSARSAGSLVSAGTDRIDQLDLAVVARGPGRCCSSSRSGAGSISSRRFFFAPRSGSATTGRHPPPSEIDPAALDAWAHSLAPTTSRRPIEDDVG